MALAFKTGFFNVNTATGNQAVTGVGFQPKAMLLWSGPTGAAAVGTFLNNPAYELGICTSPTDRRAMSGFVITTSSPYLNSRWYGNRAHMRGVMLSGGVPSLSDEMELVSFDSDGFTVNWVAKDASGYHLYYACWGGADLTNAKVVEVVGPGATGSQAVTGVGFKPDCLIFIHNLTSGASVAQTNDYVYSMGWYTGSSGRSLVQVAKNVGATNPSDLASTTNTTPILGIDPSLTTSAVQYQASVTSLDVDGFTLNWSATTGTGVKVGVLCLKGGRYSVGGVSVPTTAGTASYSTGFPPRGVFLQSVNSGVSDWKNTRSVTDGSSTAVIAEHMVDNVNPPVSAKLMTEGPKGTDFITQPNTLDAEADVTLSGSSVDFNWTTVDGTSRTIQVLAFGDNVSPTGPPGNVPPHQGARIARIPVVKTIPVG